MSVVLYGMMYGFVVLYMLVHFYSMSFIGLWFVPVGTTFPKWGKYVIGRPF